MNTITIDESFFETLTKKEAKLFLANLLEVERREFPPFAEKARAEGIVVDYTPASLPGFFRWVMGQTKTFIKEPDPTMPVWIRETETYRKALMDFEDASLKLVLRAGYYFGETLVRSFPKLSWSVGRSGYHNNMPVITGFGDGVDRAPLASAKGMMLAELSGIGQTGSIETAIMCNVQGVSAE